MKTKIIEVLEACGVDVKEQDDGGLFITYFTAHDGEENAEIPAEHCGDLRAAGAYLLNLWEDYDVSEETYIWLDDTGHGRSGAPYDLEDVLADKKEWEAKLYEMAQSLLKEER